MRYSSECVAVSAWVAVVLALSEMDAADAVPVKFMCGLCQDNFLHCMMNCQMEDYMTRNYYDKKHVYVGRQPALKTPGKKKTNLDRVFESYVHQPAQALI